MVVAVSARAPLPLFPLSALFSSVNRERNQTREMRSSFSSTFESAFSSRRSSSNTAAASSWWARLLPNKQIENQIAPTSAPQLTTANDHTDQAKTWNSLPTLSNDEERCREVDIDAEWTNEETGEMPLQWKGKYSLIEQLGEGAHGKAWAALHNETGEEVAVKWIRSAVAKKEENEETEPMEIRVLKALTERKEKPREIVEYRDHGRGDNGWWLATEKGGQKWGNRGSDLFDCIEHQ